MVSGVGRPLWSAASGNCREMRLGFSRLRPHAAPHRKCSPFRHFPPVLGRERGAALAVPLARGACRRFSADAFGETSPGAKEEERRELLRRLRLLPPDEQEDIWRDLQAPPGDGEEIPTPEAAQLMRYFAMVSVPYVGFGFADNLLMIIFGEQIEVKLGGVFHISTMVAAGFGNLFSDVIGLGLGGFIEQFSEKLGLQPHGMTPEQLTLKSSRIVGGLSALIGISVGCVLGMVPLVFEDQDKRRLHSLFNHMDMDNNGYLDENEMQAAFAKAHIYLTPSEISKLVKDADKDGDGRVDFTEFVEMFDKWKEDMQASLLTAKELEEMHKKKDETENSTKAE